MKPLFKLAKRCKKYFTLEFPLQGAEGVFYQPKIHANISGATIVASLSTINFGVVISNLHQVIFSLGTAPE